MSLIQSEHTPFLSMCNEPIALALLRLGEKSNPAKNIENAEKLARIFLKEEGVYYSDVVAAVIRELDLMIREPKPLHPTGEKTLEARFNVKK